jgi:hypothetical protein
MGLIDDVCKMHVDMGGKVSGAFLCVLLQTDRSGRKDWLDLQYEKLPFYYKSCGIMWHSKLDYENLVAWNALGKLSSDVKLRAPEDKKKKVKSFFAATVKSYGSGSSGDSAFSLWTSKKGNN